MASSASKPAPHSWFRKNGEHKQNVIRRYAKPETKALAIELRHRPAPTEKLVWQRLHALRLRFRRQAVILGWIADFYHPKSRLVVEIDGDYHNDPVQIERDVTRDRVMRARGLRILRIPASRVVSDFDSVICEILRYAGFSPDVHTHAINDGITAPPKDATACGPGPKRRGSRDGRISQTAPNLSGVSASKPAVDNAAGHQSQPSASRVLPVR